MAIALLSLSLPHALCPSPAPLLTFFSTCRWFGDGTRPPWATETKYDNVTWFYHPELNPYRSMLPDTMHDADLGLWGHLLMASTEYITKNVLGGKRHVQAINRERRLLAGGRCGHGGGPAGFRHARDDHARRRLRRRQRRRRPAPRTGKRRGGRVRQGGRRKRGEQGGQRGGSALRRKQSRDHTRAGRSGKERRHRRRDRSRCSGRRVGGSAPQSCGWWLREHRRGAPLWRRLHEGVSATPATAPAPRRRPRTHRRRLLLVACRLWRLRGLALLRLRRGLGRFTAHRRVAVRIAANRAALRAGGAE